MIEPPPANHPAIRPKKVKQVRFAPDRAAEGVKVRDEEANGILVPKAPVLPSAEEIERHNACHIPFRSWCKFCVAGKAKANPHFQKFECRPCDANVVQLDYAFMGKDGECAPNTRGISRTTCQN